MNFKQNESERKLSGRYYTPAWLASFVARWVRSFHVRSVLEPSCGEGVFFEEITKECPHKIVTMTGFDVDPAAIERCRESLSATGCDLTLRNQDFLAWAMENIRSESPERFEAVVGNPPFVRYQYLGRDEQLNAQKIFELLELHFTKHTNLWVPFVICSIEFLRPGGIIGMVIPSEILHVLYAQGLREYLKNSCGRILLLDPEDLWFEDTLQGAMLLLAQKKVYSAEESRIAVIRTHGRDFVFKDPRRIFEEAEYIPGGMFPGKWTYALLDKEELLAYERVRKSVVFSTFSQLANVDVGIVTGANRFFLVSDSTVEKYSLSEVARPMFGRSEHCPGIIYDEKQHRQNKLSGYPCNFLYFDAESDGETYSEYLASGIAEGIPARYKCRIRKPWYKVPSVFSSPVSMLKRSNGMPRLILNRLNALTTDTAYRVTPKEGVDAAALVSCFLNSVTALSAELEGRSYGGGVLELVPSEIALLLVPYNVGSAEDVDALDQKVRKLDRNTVLEMQDKYLLSNAENVNYADICLLHNAFLRLQARRQRVPTG